MRKIRYWLLLKIARRPKTFIYGAGLLIATVLTIATMVTTVWMDQSRLAAQHAEAIQIFRLSTTESTKLLNHLATHDEINCTKQDLIHLNTHLLQSRYIREIGLLNDDRALICSTALGPVTSPIKGDYPVHISKSGLEVLNNIPLSMAGRKLTAVIIQRPPFNVVISPYASDDIYASAEAVWLQTVDELVLLGSNAAPGEIPDLLARASQRDTSGFEIHGLGYELITTAPDQDIVLQSRRSLADVAREGGRLSAALLLGSLLITGLSIGAIAPWIKRLSHLKKRIGFLCKESHLALVYQPIFDLNTMRPVGCEVLTRLKEGKQSWMPDEFIPAIQEAGLEQQLDYAVTRKAIRELATHLPACDEKLLIALNYFPVSLDPAGLAPVLRNALQSAGRNDLEICLEVTEHELSTELIAEVQSLKANGFRIAVDDFGTGYSNLKSVTTLAPDLLKIDRSFVYGLEGAALRSNLIPEILNIAQAAKAQTVAEGIESMEQAEQLAAAGVRYGQGYALARPMEMAQFIALISRFK